MTSAAAVSPSAAHAPDSSRTFRPLPKCHTELLSGWRGFRWRLDYASEFRYRDPILDAETLGILIT